MADINKNATVDILAVQKEVKEKLANQEVMKTLVQTTFRGLDAVNIRSAIVEGMLRGFTFADFLQKKVYAVPFGSTYSLVGGIDAARERGAKGGVVGKSAPIFEEKDGKIISCSITLKKKMDDYVGDFTATVYFDEYSTGKNLWITKPRTMIAKVAEMSALRMAAPEALTQFYVEEEMEQGVKGREVVVPEVIVEEERKNLEAVTTLEELKTAWTNLPAEAKQNAELIALKDELKAKFTPIVEATK